MSDFFVRKLDSTDKPAIQELTELVWNDVPYSKLEKMNWVYNSSLSLCYGCFDGLQLVGNRGSCIWNLVVSGIRLNFVQLSDTCVHPQYRRYGLFTKMNKYLLEECVLYNIKGIFNVSVESSKQGYLKLGWTYLDVLKKMTYIVKPINLICKLRLNINKLKGHVVFLDNMYNDIIDDQLLNARSEYFKNTDLIYTEYDKQFISWRLLANTKLQIKNFDKLGAVIFKFGYKNELKVIEIGEVFMFENSYDCFCKLLSDIVDLLGCDLVEVSLSISHPYYKYYKKMSFISNPFKPFLNFGIRLIDDSFSEICRNPKRWSISSLDLDTF